MARFHLVDAFADRPFTGNPAGVVRLPAGAVDAGWAQQVAAEVRASETAVLVGRDDGSWQLRWWTPTREVDLCGHATLAAAHALSEDGLVTVGSRVRFHTRSGTLQVQIHEDRLALDLPAWPVTPDAVPAGLLAALRSPGARYLGRAGTPSQTNHVVELTDETAVAELDPDLTAVAAAGGTGVIVTAAAAPDRDADLVSRYLAPNAGVDEDPVTGSAHATLAPLWAGRLGREQLVADQLSPRGGRLWLTDLGERVEVAGTAVTVLAGELTT